MIYQIICRLCSNEDILKAPQTLHKIKIKKQYLRLVFKKVFSFI
ncbi:hypothetical protein PSOL_02490 [Candidatus Phytoplasma solani]